MLEIVLLDDDPVFLQELRCRVEEELRNRGKEAVLHTFQNASDILAWIGETSTLDLAILDIDMGKGFQTGIDIAAEIRRRFADCGIIYQTAYLEFATNVFETKPLYFITKQELEARLHQALDMFFREYDTGRRYIQVRFGKTNTVLSASDILYCERNRRGTRIITTHGEILATDALSELKKRLPSERFAACHNSYLINLDYLSGYDRQFAVMSNGDTVPISRAGRQEFLEKISAFLRGKIEES